jgi:arylsulfatase A-like enzyme
MKWITILILTGCTLKTFAEEKAQTPERPNILFAIADDWSPHAGAYGTKWVKTPAFDRIAREGLVFDRAYTPNAKCAPSRACLLTGRNSWQLKEAANHICYFPSEFKGWGEVLAEKGWTVGYTQKGWGPGSATDADGKPRLMTGQAFNQKRATPPTPEISEIDYAGNFTAFLDQAKGGKPWCFWYGAIEPHRGYEFGSGIAKGGKKISDIDHVPACWPDNADVRTDMLDYAYEVEHFDNHLARMIAELEKRNLLDNTLIIVTSDHGMPFPRAKGNAYELANHVPLAMRWPGGIEDSGRRIDEFISFIDIAPTILDVAKIPWKDSGMAPTSGQSLRPVFENSSDRNMRQHVLIGKERTDIGRPNDGGYPTRGIITKQGIYLKNFEPTRWPGGNPETGYLDCDAGITKSLILQKHRNYPNDRSWQLCFGRRPAEEFYLFASDPDCIKNLATNEEHSAVMKKMRETMIVELTEQGDPRMLGKGHVFDEYQHANKGHVGFYERFMEGEKLQTGWVLPSDYEKEPLDQDVEPTKQ